MKRLIQVGIVSTGLLFVMSCGVKASDIKSVNVNNGGCIEKKGCEKKLLFSMNKPYEEYEIDLTYLMPQIPIVHTLKTVQGKSVKIVEQKNGFKFPQYNNKIVILELFGKNCHHCIKEIALLNKIRKKYNKKLEVVSIQVEEPMGEFSAHTLIKKHQIKYPIIDGEESIDLQSFIQETYEWRGILPYTLIIKNGLTEFSYSGKVTYQEIQRDISSLI